MPENNTQEQGIEELRRRIDALLPRRMHDYFDLNDEETREAYFSALKDYRQRYADRDLPELGALLTRVRFQIQDIQVELISDRPDMDVYRSIGQRDLFRTYAEMHAIESIVDESRQPPDRIRQGPKVAEIRDAIEELSGQDFSSRAELLRAVDEVRGAGEGVTYRYLNRRFGKTLPTDLEDFTRWIQEMARPR